MALKQETMHFHHPINPIHVYTRATLFSALMAEQSMDALIAVGRLTGDQRLDLRDKLRLGLRTSSATLASPGSPGG
jgi:hypothetical protein